MLLLIAVLCLMLLTPARAEEAPVAVVAEVYGGTGYQPDSGTPAVAVDWLQLLRPGELVSTLENGKVVVMFLHDGHIEVVDPNASAQVGFQSLKAGSGKVRAHPAPTWEFLWQPPLWLESELTLPATVDPDALRKEKTYLAARVKSEAFPPVFYCQDLGLKRYRFQIFDPQGQFLYEGASDKPRLRLPFRGVRLTKGVRHFWQVVDAEDTVLVARSPFVMLTQAQARQLKWVEKNLDRKSRLDQARLLLFYHQLGLVDKALHLAVQTDDKPLQARLYLERGCPAHARQALD